MAAHIIYINDIKITISDNRLRRFWQETKLRWVLRTLNVPLVWFENCLLVKPGWLYYEQLFKELFVYSGVCALTLVACSVANEALLYAMSPVFSGLTNSTASLYQQVSHNLRDRLQK